MKDNKNVPLVNQSQLMIQARPLHHFTKMYSNLWLVLVCVCVCALFFFRWYFSLNDCTIIITDSSILFLSFVVFFSF